MERPVQTLSLSELQQAVKGVLADRFALPLWVTAEISEIKVNYSGHCYLELVEKGVVDGVPRAQARAVIWRSSYPRIAGYFEAATGRPLAAGIKMLAKVTVNYHELYGFSLQILDIDTAYTLGDIERQRLETIARLRCEGVWEMNRETDLPPVIQRAAVVSSRQAAGYQDFCNELRKSPYLFRTELFDAFMQGAAAEESVVAALGEIALRLEDFDVVVIIRGGGSASDLSCFDSYRLCNHIAQFPLPVVTGIGHDKDVSVADQVAHTALKTPTAVAGWLVERMDGIMGWLDHAAVQLHEMAVAASRDRLLQLERQAATLRQLAEALAARERLRTAQFAERLPEAVAAFLERQRQRLETAAQLVESRSPQRILRLGFSVVRRNGRALTSAKGLRAGERLEVELADGRIETRVEK